MKYLFSRYLILLIFSLLSLSYLYSACNTPNQGSSVCTFEFGQVPLNQGNVNYSLTIPSGIQSLTINVESDINTITITPIYDPEISNQITITFVSNTTRSIRTMNLRQNAYPHEYYKTRPYTLKGSLQSIHISNLNIGGSFASSSEGLNVSLENLSLGHVIFDKSIAGSSRVSISLTDVNVDKLTCISDYCNLDLSNAIISDINYQKHGSTNTGESGFINVFSRSRINSGIIIQEKKGSPENRFINCSFNPQAEEHLYTLSNLELGALNLSFFNISDSILYGTTLSNSILDNVESSPSCVSNDCSVKLGDNTIVRNSNFSTNGLRILDVNGSNVCIINNSFSNNANAVLLSNNSKSIIVGNVFNDVTYPIWLTSDVNVAVHTNMVNSSRFIATSSDSRNNVVRLKVATSISAQGMSIGPLDSNCDVGLNPSSLNSAIGLEFNDVIEYANDRFGIGNLRCLGGNYYPRIFTRDLQNADDLADNVSESDTYSAGGGYSDTSLLTPFGSDGYLKLDLNFGDYNTFKEAINSIESQYESVYGARTAIQIGKLSGSNIVAASGFKLSTDISGSNFSTRFNPIDYNFYLKPGKYDLVMNFGLGSRNFDLSVNVKTPVMKLRLNKSTSSVDYQFPHDNGAIILLSSSDENVQIIGFENIDRVVLGNLGLFNQWTGPAQMLNPSQKFYPNGSNIDSGFVSCYSVAGQTSTYPIDNVNCLARYLQNQDFNWRFRVTLSDNLLDVNFKPKALLLGTDIPACVIVPDESNDLNLNYTFKNNSYYDLNLSYNVQSYLWDLSNRKVYPDAISSALKRDTIAANGSKALFYHKDYNTSTNYDLVKYGSAQMNLIYDYNIPSANISKTGLTISDNIYFIPRPPIMSVGVKNSTYTKGLTLDSNYLCGALSAINIASNLPTSPIVINRVQDSSLRLDINVDYINFTQRSSLPDFNKYYLAVYLQTPTSYKPILVYNRDILSYITSSSSCGNDYSATSGSLTPSADESQFVFTWDFNSITKRVGGGPCNPMLGREEVLNGDYNLLFVYGSINSLTSIAYIQNNGLFLSLISVPIRIERGRDDITMSDFSISNSCFDSLDWMLKLSSGFELSNADINVVFTNSNGDVIHTDNRTQNIDTGINEIRSSFSPKEKGIKSPSNVSARVYIAYGERNYSFDKTFSINCIRTVATPDMNLYFVLIVIAFVVATYIIRR